MDKQVINPRTGRKIDRETLEKVFAEQLATDQTTRDLTAATALASEIKFENLTAIIWYQRSRMGLADGMPLNSGKGHDINSAERDRPIRIEFAQPPKRDE